MSDILTINRLDWIQDAYAGFFVSRGEGKHPQRCFDHYALFYITQGTMGMREEKRTFDLQAGDTLLLVPGRTHGGTEMYPSGLNLYWINFKLQPRKSNALFHLPQHTHIHRHANLVEWFRTFLNDQESGTLDSHQAHFLTMLILNEISRGAAPASMQSWNALVSQAQNYIASHCHEPLSTSKIAAMLHCNPDYLSRIFKKTTGRSVTDEIHHKRIHLAKKNLLESAMNISEVAFNSGYENLSYFHRMFRRIAGMTPGQYQQLHNRMFVDTR